MATAIAPKRGMRDETFRLHHDPISHGC